MHSCSRRVFSSARTPLSASGQCFAGVGKHELKFESEFALIEADSAPAKTLCKVVARGPGADATGASSGGDGEREGGAIILAVI